MDLAHSIFPDRRGGATIRSWLPRLARRNRVPSRQVCPLRLSALDDVLDVLWKKVATLDQFLGGRPQLQEVVVAIAIALRERQAWVLARVAVGLRHRERDVGAQQVVNLVRPAD